MPCNASSSGVWACETRAKTIRSAGILYDVEWDPPMCNRGVEPSPHPWTIHLSPSKRIIELALIRRRPSSSIQSTFGNLSRRSVCIDVRLGERLQVSKIRIEVYCVGARSVGKIRVSRREIGNIVVNKYACRFAWVFKCCRDEWLDQSRGSSLMSIHANYVLPCVLPKLNKESQYAYSWTH